MKGLAHMLNIIHFGNGYICSNCSLKSVSARLHILIDIPVCTLSIAYLRCLLGSYVEKVKFFSPFFLFPSGERVNKIFVVSSDQESR